MNYEKGKASSQSVVSSRLSFARYDYNRPLKIGNTAVVTESIILMFLLGIVGTK
jgi:hypothetical protein